jgi:hypothetical protein
LRGAVFAPEEAARRLPLARAIARDVFAHRSAGDAAATRAAEAELAQLGFRAPGDGPRRLECFAEVDRVVTILSVGLQEDAAWSQRPLAAPYAEAHPLEGLRAPLTPPAPEGTGKSRQGKGRASKT